MGVWVNSSCNSLVLSGAAEAQSHIFHFYLMMECCGAHPPSWLGGTDNTQFMMDSSGCMGTWWPMVQPPLRSGSQPRALPQKESTVNSRTTWVWTAWVLLFSTHTYQYYSTTWSVVIWVHDADVSWIHADPWIHRANCKDTQGSSAVQRINTLNPCIVQGSTVVALLQNPKGLHCISPIGTCQRLLTAPLPATATSHAIGSAASYGQAGERFAQQPGPVAKLLLFSAPLKTSNFLDHSVNDPE